MRARKPARLLIAALCLLVLPMLGGAAKVMGAPAESALAASARVEAAAADPVALLVGADDAVVPALVGQTQVTARVRDQAGSPVKDALVVFSSQLGSVSAVYVLSNVAGVATTTFTAGAAAGQGTVTATCAGLTDSVAIQIAGGQPAGAVDVMADMGDILPGEDAVVTVTVRDAAGAPVSNEMVSLVGTLGEISPASGVTGSDGRLTAVFSAGDAPGLAAITALAGSVYGTTNVRVAGAICPDYADPPGIGSEDIEDAAALWHAPSDSSGGDAIYDRNGDGIIDVEDIMSVAVLMGAACP